MLILDREENRVHRSLIVPSDKSKTQGTLYFDN